MEKNEKFVCEASVFNSPFRYVGTRRCKGALQEQGGHGHTNSTLSLPIFLEKVDAGNKVSPCWAFLCLAKHRASILLLLCRAFPSLSLVPSSFEAGTPILAPMGKSVLD